ncbi:MFS transporter [Desulfofustis glycolicus]|uniref:Major Facilitator Superfamily protein n=1 Tax=Desulfofustis glycolicus DSM 9705 TaxID=1121409 RepID=A0A1M5TSR3_9BACT|nr:MFS transporter [Desulfofustis glycolicus]MCB2216578.1 MFS transporter [Desulfobulbaceae bacterium]SHH53764.1 Major Facilitator Superfamily protein [Desulfofustis glycolicus DSM 9705]
MDSEKDACFRRNVVGSSIVEFFWGLGFPIVLESTFLQLFLKHLGASGFAIGLVPALFIAGVSCFPLFASYLSRNYRLKRPFVIGLHLSSALTILLLGVLLMIFGESAGVLPLFFCCYALFSISMGLSIPVWLNYLVRIFPETRTVSGLGYMMLAQNCGKIVASFFILKTVQRYSFSVQAAAIVFIVTGLLFVAGSLCFLITREVPDPDDPEPDQLSFWRHTAASVREIMANRRFLRYTVADLDFYVILTIMSFYANYATTYYQVPAAIAAGGFVACIYAGSITVNIFLGAMNLLSLKGKFVLAKLVTLALLAIMVLWPSLPTFYLISYLLGFVRAIRNMVYAPAVKKISGKTDVTPYFSLAPIISLPFAVGYPLLFGLALDTLSFPQQDAYKILFAGSALIVLGTLVLCGKADFLSDSDRPRRARTEPLQT